VRARCRLSVRLSVRLFAV